MSELFGLPVPGQTNHQVGQLAKVGRQPRIVWIALVDDAAIASLRSLVVRTHVVQIRLLLHEPPARSVGLRLGQGLLNEPDGLGIMRPFPCENRQLPDGTSFLVGTKFLGKFSVSLNKLLGLAKTGHSGT